MHDLRAIRENPAAFDAGLAARGLPPQAGSILDLDERRRALQTALQDLQNRRNAASKDIGAAKAAKDEARASTLMGEVAALKGRLPELEQEEQALARALDELLMGLPNLPADDVPIGPDESANVEIRRVGAPRSFAFTPRDHVAVGAACMDFDAASRMSGARFVVLRGVLARLERAIASFMLDLHTGEFGYSEIAPPLLVRDDAMYGTAQLPKFRDDQFGASGDFWLIPTAEVPLTNLVREQILTPDRLPMRVTAWTACFRREAGAGARHTRHDPPASVLQGRAGLDHRARRRPRRARAHDGVRGGGAQAP